MTQPTPQSITGERAMEIETEEMQRSTGERETLADWLAAKLGTTRQDAEQRLAESRRVAWAMSRSDAGGEP
jgi:hypothetical protein